MRTQPVVVIIHLPLCLCVSFGGTFWYKKSELTRAKRKKQDVFALLCRVCEQNEVHDSVKLLDKINERMFLIGDKDQERLQGIC